MRYDAVVIGAGHAGCEAALALSRLGFETLLLTLHMSGVALMACNPAIGGTGKGHLVREVDALGGEMGLAIDGTLVQSRMLNSTKGPAVQSLRAQADKAAYQARMLRAVCGQERLTVRQGEASEILVKGGRVQGVVTATGGRIECRAVVVAAGVYLNSRILTGEAEWDAGPAGLTSSGKLSRALEKLGMELKRFKTGTPARLDGRTIDFDRLEAQRGDDPPTPFSFMTDEFGVEQMPCYVTATNEAAHDVIRRNLDRAPMYSGRITGVGARYCPSIEDKVVRFPDRASHTIFLEPEGRTSFEWYAQGLSTSMPEDVQWELYRSLPGLERVVLTRLAYAIEYDLIDATELSASLEHKRAEGLFFAGQINGTSGYEEAAAQGIIAGINAALRLKGEPPFVLGRDEAYAGVLIDDLVTKGTNEPYRMMTSRAEYRLTLRQDNADLRLTPRAYALGLASDERMRRMELKRERTERALASLERAVVQPDSPAMERIEAALRSRGDAFVRPRSAVRASELLRRPALSYADLSPVLGLPGLPREVREQVDVRLIYQGYLQKQEQEIARFRAMEDALLPDIDYLSVGALRVEARQKLDRLRPRSLGQASRISGVSPADIAVLMALLRAKGGAK